MTAAVIDGIAILKNEPLSKYTFTRTGGPADQLAFPRSVEEVQALVRYADQQDLPLTVIGNASNLIVRDGGIRGLTLILTGMDQIQVAGDQVVAQAGARLIDTTEAAYRAGLSGFEFACGIPGSVGGAVYMNAGAYGGEIQDLLVEVTVLTASGQLKHYDNATMAFSYRHSVVQDNGDVVLSATFQLTPAPKPDIRARMDKLNARRASKQPLEYPSCGSVFKRPKGHYVGPMIQQAGLQGHKIGGAQISMKHAGFIVNVNHATATDYMAMIRYVQKNVLAKFGVQLEPEVRIMGAEETV